MRAVGVHDGLSAILAQNHGFDALWAGGLGICTATGVPDAGVLSMTELLDAVVRMRRVSALPIIADVDSGFGDVNVVQRMVRLFEAAGVAAVCIEDKQYPKRNSFRGGNALEDPAVFARKIAAAKAAQAGDEFMVVARLESLIAGAGLDDALQRAAAYLDAGADALLVHSRARTPHEVGEFAERLRALGVSVPLFMIPTTYHRTTARELGELGASAVIYANHPIRAALRAMSDVLDQINRDDTTTSVETEIATVNDLFQVVGTDDLLDDEPWLGLLEQESA
jgi:phosphoenolpyruvate phosphomutase